MELAEVADEWRYWWVHWWLVSWIKFIFWIWIRSQILHEFEFELCFFKVNEFEFRFFQVNQFEFRFFKVNEFEFKN